MFGLSRVARPASDGKERRGVEGARPRDDEDFRIVRPKVERRVGVGVNVRMAQPKR